MLFTFPSRYWFTIGRQLVFSLTRWSARLHTAFHVCRATLGLPRAGRIFGHGSLTLSGASFHTLDLIFPVPHRGPKPRRQSLRFGLFRFRSPLLTESILFLFLRLLRCFTSPGLANPLLCIQSGTTGYYPGQVTPFGNLRVKAYLPLSEAYRSLSRPSSPVGTKAFTMRS